MKKALFATILVTCWLSLASADIKYYIEPDALICFSIQNNNLYATTCVPCNLIPMRLLRIYKNGVIQDSYEEMTSHQRELYQSLIIKKYGSVGE